MSTMRSTDEIRAAQAAPDRALARLSEGPFRQATDEDAEALAMHNLMRAGFGFEDIAHKLGIELGLVMEEVELLRAEGRLDALYTGRLAEEVAASTPAIAAPVEPPRPAERRAAFLQRAAEALAFAMKAKGQMRAKGLTRARKACPRCGGIVHLALVGGRGHVHAACETPSCLRVTE